MRRENKMACESLAPLLSLSPPLWWGFVACLVHFYQLCPTAPHPQVGFPGGAVVENPPTNDQCRRCKGLRFDPWVGKIAWRRKRQSTPVFLPGEFHGQRRLACYSPWGRKESDTTERAHTHTQTHTPHFHPPKLPPPEITWMTGPGLCCLVPWKMQTLQWISEVLQDGSPSVIKTFFLLSILPLSS